MHFVLLPSEHSPQAPVGWQAGVAPPHSPSTAQERQVCVPRLQTGVVPPHWAFEMHGTQVAVVTSHAGVAPTHLIVFVAEQIPQAPLAWHAGVAPPHSPSAAQARQMCVAMPQTGVAPPHWVFDTQGTQLPVVV